MTTGKNHVQHRDLAERVHVDEFASEKGHCQRGAQDRDGIYDFDEHDQPSERNLSQR